MGLVKIISTAFKTLRGAPGKSLVANVSGIGEKSFECELYSVPGVQGRPANESHGVIVRFGSLRFVFATHDYKLDKALAKGETLVYSINDNGVIQAQAHFDGTGQIILNEGTDYAVKYNELATAFNQLKADFDAHVHGGVETGAGSTAAPTASTADITPARVVNIRL